MDNNINIGTLFYIGKFELPDKNAGAQRVIANAKILRSLGYKVVLVGASKTLSKNSGLVKRKDVFGFDSWELPYPQSGSEWLSYITRSNYIEPLFELYTECKAVITYNHPAVSSFGIYRKSRRRKVYYIPDTTEWYDSKGRGFLKNSIKWLDTTVRMRFVNVLADGMITTSPYLTKFYRKKVKHLIELPTLYDSDSFGDLSIKKPMSKPLSIMYAGSPFKIDGHKNAKAHMKDRLDLVIRLIGEASLKDLKIKLNIFGLTDKRYLAIFPEHKKYLEVSDITFHGRVSHSDIIRNIKEHDFTIFLRDFDRVTEAGFPSKLAESTTCGTPVITNKRSNVLPYLSEGKNGYYIELNNLEMQMEKLYEISKEDSSKLRSMREYCLEKNFFHYEKFTFEMKRFLSKVFNES